MRGSRTSERSLLRRQEGIALIVTLMIMMLVSILMVGFVTAIVADQRASGLDRDQTQAYAAAHAGLEQLTSDLSNLFTSDFSPSANQLNALTATTPSLPGFTFVAPGGGSGYGITYDVDANGNPRPEDPINGSPITAGPYQGFRGILTPYDITVTARSRGGAEVRMRRTLQTVAIPVFQFGMFSESSLAFHSGEAFNMVGRVHTNGSLYLANGDGFALTIGDRVTAVNEVIRTHLPNGLAIANGYTGTVRVPTTIASNPVNNVYRNLASNEGSLTANIGSAQNEPKWTQVSIGTYASNIRNGRTGARTLNLPIVADLDGDGQPDAQPIQLIRRPAQNSNENVANKFVYDQRFFGLASLRILLSDADANITQLPTIVTATAPISLNATTSLYTPLVDVKKPPLAGSALLPLLVEAGGTLPAEVYRSTGAPLIGGVIKIEMQRQNGTWVDVTAEILNLGIAGRNLARKNINTPSGTGGAGAWNTSYTAGTAAETCDDPNPNAVIRLQRVRDVPFAATGANPSTDARCGVTTAAGVVTAVSTRPTDYWPLSLYDPREGHMRDGLADGLTDLTLGGIVQYVELDVRNLKRWLRGEIGASGNQAKNDNGFIVYFSDRRNNRNGAGQETGEYGWEDIVNPASAPGTFNNVLDAGEDLNGNGVLDSYGSLPQNAQAVGALAPLNPLLNPPPRVTTVLTDATAGGPVVAIRPLVKALVAKANRTLFFRRALKVTNGGIYAPFTQGLTITSENPVYLQGDYNATAASTTAAGNIPAALIADTVTLLSNAWNDNRSFMSPGQAQGRRDAATTGYRLAIVSGKSLTFPKPGFADASFGSDGGAHNFLRNLEYWTANGITQRYRGSLVSFFFSRQATGTFKCCDYDVYNKPDVRDMAFDTEFLLPARLPPGTPMFRDVNTLTFRQLLRPNQ